MESAMFQYATRHIVLVDTPPITLASAKALFSKNREDFIKRLENGQEPEMAIWINCNDSQSYGETLYHWVGSDMKVIEGRLYQAV